MRKQAGKHAKAFRYRGRNTVFNQNLNKKYFIEKWGKPK